MKHQAADATSPRNTKKDSWLAGTHIQVARLRRSSGYAQAVADSKVAGMAVGTHGRLPTRRRMVLRWVRTGGCRCTGGWHGGRYTQAVADAQAVGNNRQVLFCQCKS